MQVFFCRARGEIGGLYLGERREGFKSSPGLLTSLVSSAAVFPGSAVGVGGWDDGINRGKEGWR